MVLKGRNHPTFGWTINAETELGNTIVQAKDGRYYSRGKGQQLSEGDIPINLTEQEQRKAKDAAATKIREQSTSSLFENFIDPYKKKSVMLGLAKDNQYRNDGTKKGTGWLGVIDLGDDNVATEYTTQSQAVQVNGKQIDFPSLVPTLTPEEVETMKGVIRRRDKKIPDEIMQKAVDHAKKQLSEGKSVFVQPKTIVDKVNDAIKMRPAYRK